MKSGDRSRKCLPPIFLAAMPTWWEGEKVFTREEHLARGKKLFSHGGYIIESLSWTRHTREQTKTWSFFNATQCFIAVTRVCDKGLGEKFLENTRRNCASLLICTLFSTTDFTWKHNMYGIVIVRATDVEAKREKEINTRLYTRVLRRKSVRTSFVLSCLTYTLRSNGTVARLLCR